MATHRIEGKKKIKAVSLHSFVIGHGFGSARPGKTYELPETVAAKVLALHDGKGQPLAVAVEEKEKTKKVHTR